MNLHSINRAREEARYISRTWSNTPAAPDKSYPIQPTKPARVSYWVSGKDGLLHKKTCTPAQWEFRTEQMLKENARRLAELDRKTGGLL